MTAVHCVVALLELLLFASVVSGEISQTSSIGEVATMDFNTSVVGGEVECGQLVLRRVLNLALMHKSSSDSFCSFSCSYRNCDGIS